jgi:hypothetical protein
MVDLLIAVVAVDLAPVGSVESAAAAMVAAAAGLVFRGVQAMPLAPALAVEQWVRDVPVATTLPWVELDTLRSLQLSLHRLITVQPYLEP